MLARLRPDLDFFPSPVEDKPGLVIRDPFHYSDATLIIPPALVRAWNFSTASTASWICARTWCGSPAICSAG